MTGAVIRIGVLDAVNVVGVDEAVDGGETGPQSPCELSSSEVLWKRRTRTVRLSSSTR